MTFTAKKAENRRPKPFLWPLIIGIVVVSVLIIGGIAAAMLLTDGEDRPHLVLTAETAVHKAPDEISAVVQTLTEDDRPATGHAQAQTGAPK